MQFYNGQVVQIGSCSQMSSNISMLSSTPLFTSIESHTKPQQKKLKCQSELVSIVLQVINSNDICGTILIHQNNCKQLQIFQGDTLARGYIYNATIKTKILCHGHPQKKGTQEDQPYDTTIKPINTNFFQNQHEIQYSKYKT